MADLAPMPRRARGRRQGAGTFDLVQSKHLVEAEPTSDDARPRVHLVSLFQLEPARMETKACSVGHSYALIERDTFDRRAQRGSIRGVVKFEWQRQTRARVEGSQEQRRGLGADGAGEQAGRPKMDTRNSCFIQPDDGPNTPICGRGRGSCTTPSAGGSARS